jgi:hypothetical protein
MTSKNAWDSQREDKYRNHDLHVSDIKPMAIEEIRSQARDQLIRGAECDNVKLIVENFMAHLARSGYRITKVT